MRFKLFRYICEFVDINKGKQMGIRLCSSWNNLTPSHPTIKKYLDNIMSEYNALSTQTSLDDEKRRRLSSLSVTTTILEEKRKLQENLLNLTEFENSKDEELRILAREEKETYSEKIMKLDGRVIDSLLSENSDNLESTVLVEICPGTGGQEAMLFAAELYKMYSGLSNHCSWNAVVVEEDKSDLGGIRHVILMIRGVGVKSKMVLEAGVHRVQRIPVTEKGGRLHTSTAVVAVLPEPTDVKLDLPEKDLKIETKRASGAGGQHVNKTESAVRIIHIPTGIAVECQEGRSQIQNRATAMLKLRARILKRMQEEVDSSIRTERKAQMGTGDRNEKIRTYNYNQDRVTDHRITGGTVRNLSGVLNGGSALESLQLKLKRHLQLQKLLEEIKLSTGETIC